MCQAPQHFHVKYFQYKILLVFLLWVKLIHQVSLNSHFEQPEEFDFPFADRRTEFVHKIVGQLRQVPNSNTSIKTSFHFNILKLNTRTNTLSRSKETMGFITPRIPLTVPLGRTITCRHEKPK